MSGKEKQLLIDTMTFKAQMLESNSNNGGKIVVRGEFARGDLATENKRVYPKSLWEREIKRLDKQLKERKVYGELDHPMDGRTQLKRASHLLTGLSLDGDVVVGEAEILNTTEGKNLKAIIEAGGAVGVSSRGFGTTRPGKMGEDIVQDDYRLMTFDFVAEPANTTSYPKVYKEDTDSAEVNVVEESISELTVEKVKEVMPSLYENIVSDAEKEWEKKAAAIWAEKILAAKEEGKAEIKDTVADSLKDEFSKNLQTALSQVKADLDAQLRAEAEADPELAGAKFALESIKNILRPFIMPSDALAIVQERDSEINSLKEKLVEANNKVKDLESQVDELAALAKQAGYKFHVEHRINAFNVEYSDFIRAMVGDVNTYDSLESVDSKVDALIEQISLVEEKNRKAEEAALALRQQNNELREAAEKAVEAGKVNQIKAYFERRVANHPRSKELRGIFESSDLNSKEEIDQLLESFRKKTVDPDSLNAARARVREMVGSNGRESLIEHEENPAKSAGKAGYNGLELDLNSLKILSGIEKGN